MANDISMTAPYRDYYLTAPRRSATTQARGAWHILLNDGTSSVLLNDGASFLIFALDSNLWTYEAIAPYRDYVLTAPKRQ